METLNEQARRLSSGTIASLIGMTHYVLIDLVRAHFVSFCDALTEKPERWQDAWNLYENNHESGLRDALQTEIQNGLDTGRLSILDV